MFFAKGVEQPVVRENEIGTVTDEQITVDGNAARLEVVNFFEQSQRVDDDAVADDVELAGIEDAGGDEMENVLLVADLDGVPGVVAALIADDNVGLLGQDVNDFAFAFIAPLGAN